MPVIRLKTVVFPAPLGPMILIISPGQICRFTSCTAASPPKCLETFCKSSRGWTECSRSCTTLIVVLSPARRLFYANFGFKAWISCCDIQRTQFQCGLLFWSAGQFTPPTRAWDETCRPEDHNHNENDPEDQVTNIAEGKTRNNVYDELVKAMQEVRWVRSQRVQRVQDKQVDGIDGKRAHNHARDAAYTADDNHGQVNHRVAKAESF